MKKHHKQKEPANPLKQGAAQMKTMLIVLLSVCCTCVSSAQMPAIKQGPVAKGVKFMTQALYMGEDDACYYFFDGCGAKKNTILGFDKSDLSKKVEKEFKTKLSMRFPIYGIVHGDTIEMVIAKSESRGYQLEKSIIKKSDMTLTSTEDIGFSLFEDGKKHTVNMDPVMLMDEITVTTKCSPDQSCRALVRLDQCKDGVPIIWNVTALDNRNGATLWNRDTGFQFSDFVTTNDGKVILVGYFLADTEDKVMVSLIVMSGDGEELMTFALPANIGSAELALSGDRLFVTGSLKGETYGQKGLFWKDVTLSGMYVTLFDMNEQTVIASYEYPFTKEDIDVYYNEKDGKSKESTTKWIHFHPYFMSDGRVCVMSEYDYRIVSNSPTSGRGGINANTGNYYNFGKKGCFLTMFDANGNLLWRKPFKNEIVGGREVVSDDLFEINGNLCYYSMVSAKYKFPSDVAASQDPRQLQTKLREIILDQDGNETVNVIDGKGVFGIAAQGYNAAKTKRVFLLMEMGLLNSDVRLVLVE